MKYENFSFENKAVVEQLLSSNKPEIIIRAIVGMVNGIDDSDWVQDQLFALVESDNYWIAKNAITAFGDLARIHGKLDLTRLTEVFHRIKNAELQPSIFAALDDINIFIQ